MSDFDKIKEALENSGIYVETLSAKSLLSDYLLDSISFVSFLVAIEDIFNVEIPDEFYIKKFLTLDIGSFYKDIIQKCKNLEV